MTRKLLANYTLSLLDPVMEIEWELEPSEGWIIPTWTQKENKNGLDNKAAYKPHVVQ